MKGFCEEYGVGHGWNWWLEHQCHDDPKGCVFPQPCQPSNAYSCFSFMVAGILIMFLGLWHPHISEDPESVCFFTPLGVRMYIGMCIYLLGLGSIMSHSCVVLWGHDSTVLSQLGQLLVNYCVLLAICFRIFGVVRTKNTYFQKVGKRHAVFSVIHVVLSFGTCIAVYTVSQSQHVSQWIRNNIVYVVYAIILVVAACLELYLRTHTNYELVTISPASNNWGLACISFLLVAYWFWVIDYCQIICYPNSVYQGHAVWHVLFSCAVFCFCSYMATENWKIYVQFTDDNYDTNNTDGQLLLEGRFFPATPLGGPVDKYDSYGPRFLSNSPDTRYQDSPDLGYQENSLAGNTLTGTATNYGGSTTLMRDSLGDVVR